MRIIYKASMVFLLKDTYSKAPITNAVILCNGKQNPYTRKKEGYYVFSNFYPGDYEISIMCAGYADVNFSVNLKDNETKVMEFDLPYTLNNPIIRNLTRFEIAVSENKVPVSNADISVKLKNEISFLKLTEPAEAGSDLVKLNFEMMPWLLGQKYVYKFKKQEHVLYLNGYDSEKKSYVLKDELTEKLEPEGKFYAVWDLKTNSSGKIVLPLISRFMNEDVIKFECFKDDLKAGCTAKLTDNPQTGSVFKMKARLKK